MPDEAFAVRAQLGIEWRNYRRQDAAYPSQTAQVCITPCAIGGSYTIERSDSIARLAIRARVERC